MAMGYDAEVIHKSNDNSQNECSQQISRGDHSMRVAGKPAVSAAAMVTRMQEAVNVKTDVELTAILGLGGNAVSNWRNRNSAPYAYCASLAEEFGVSMDWLVFGKGPRRAARAAETVTARTTISGDGLSPSARRITQFVSDWDASRPEDEAIWLEQHIKRTVPEYAAWLAEHPGV
jgi:hypothetical protein